MKYLRKVKGVTRTDKIKNEIIREELGAEPVNAIIERQELRWFGHLVRMNKERPTKRIWEAKCKKNRKRGRPKKCWNDQIAEVLQERGSNWTIAKAVAKIKKQWAEFIYK